mmetsp:Transcript_615/g.2046  ORF Transcript_615/g.2046 Transcript_615/m.2046 type:complete len:245 (+) Transcript_615:252-986(+)
MLCARDPRAATETRTRPCRRPLDWCCSSCSTALRATPSLPGRWRGASRRTRALGPWAVTWRSASTRRSGPGPTRAPRPRPWRPRAPPRPSTRTCPPSSWAASWRGSPLGGTCARSSTPCTRYPRSSWSPLLARCTPPRAHTCTAWTARSQPPHGCSVASNPAWPRVPGWRPLRWCCATPCRRRAGACCTSCSSAGWTSRTSKSLCARCGASASRTTTWRTCSWPCCCCAAGSQTLSACTRTMRT